MGLFISPPRAAQPGVVTRRVPYLHFQLMTRRSEGRHGRSLEALNFTPVRLMATAPHQRAPQAEAPPANGSVIRIRTYHSIALNKRQFFPIHSAPLSLCTHASLSFFPLPFLFPFVGTHVKLNYLDRCSSLASRPPPNQAKREGRGERGV